MLWQTCLEKGIRITYYVLKKNKNAIAPPPPQKKKRQKVPQKSHYLWCISYLPNDEQLTSGHNVKSCKKCQVVLPQTQKILFHIFLWTLIKHLATQKKTIAKKWHNKMSFSRKLLCVKPSHRKIEYFTGSIHIIE